VVVDPVVTKLRAQRLLPLGRAEETDENTPLISIERFSITQKEQVDEVYKTGTARATKPPLSFVPPPLPAKPPPRRRPSCRLLNRVRWSRIPDPMIKGNPMGKDSLVTVLAVIVIDPVTRCLERSGKRKPEPAKAPAPVVVPAKQAGAAVAPSPTPAARPPVAPCVCLLRRPGGTNQQPTRPRRQQHRLARRGGAGDPTSSPSPK